MDDDEMVGKTVENMLKYMGYETKLARDGDEAINMYKDAMKNKKEFDAVILDLTVPGGMDLDC